AGAGPVATGPSGRGAAVAPAATDAGAAPPAPATAVSAAEIAHLLDAARKAAAAGRYLAPPGDCLRDLLARVEQAEPRNAEASALRARTQKALHKDAKALLRKRRHDSAEAAYRALHGLDRRDDRATAGLAEALLARAEQDLKRKRYGAASADAREAITLDGANPRAHLVLADALCKSDNYAAAVEEYGRVLQLKPKHRDAKKALAKAEKLAAKAAGAAPTPPAKVAPPPAPKPPAKPPKKRGRR
ncbi:MAG TPA: tetratricopeptide repeat protein, partial [Polyangia bacterium]